MEWMQYESNTIDSHLSHLIHEGGAGLECAHTPAAQGEAGRSLLWTIVDGCMRLGRGDFSISRNNIILFILDFTFIFTLYCLVLLVIQFCIFFKLEPVDFSWLLVSEGVRVTVLFLDQKIRTPQNLVWTVQTNTYACTLEPIPKQHLTTSHQPSTPTLGRERKVATISSDSSARCISPESLTGSAAVCCHAVCIQNPHIDCFDKGVCVREMVGRSFSENIRVKLWFTDIDTHSFITLLLSIVIQ